MKAYEASPKCGTKNESKWLMDRISKPYYSCICVECNNHYYQTNQRQEPEKQDSNNSGQSNDKVQIKSTEIEPIHLDPVPYITTVSPPRKRGKDTTSQARL